MPGCLGESADLSYPTLHSIHSQHHEDVAMEYDVNFGAILQWR